MTNRARKLSNRDRMVGTMTLAPLKNTQPEPAPTEDTSAAKQEQASLQEQLARSNPRRALGHCCSRRFEPPPAPVRARASLSLDLSSTSAGRYPTFSHGRGSNARSRSLRPS